MSEISVFIVDDHKLVRAGLRMLIDSEPDMKVVGEAGDGREAIAQASVIQPDVLIMDLSMPKVSGLVAAATLKRIAPSIKILTLTRHADKAYLQELWQAGISGYVLKQSESEEMLRAVRVVAGGDQYLDPAITGSLLSLLASGQNKNPSWAKPEILTDRESEVLRRVARGYSNKEIAEHFGSSVKTIESQKASALRKLDIKGRNEIVDYAILRGWLENS